MPPGLSRPSGRYAIDKLSQAVAAVKAAAAASAYLWMVDQGAGFVTTKIGRLKDNGISAIPIMLKNVGTW